MNADRKDVGQDAILSMNSHGMVQDADRKDVGQDAILSMNSHGMVQDADRKDVGQDAILSMNSHSLGYSSEIWGTGHSLIPGIGVPNLLGVLGQKPEQVRDSDIGLPKILTYTP